MSAADSYTTPRTDAFEDHWNGQEVAFQEMTEFARQLERELDETRAKYERLQQSAVGWQEQLEKRSTPEHGKGWRTCEFCGCNTNAKLRRCCEKGVAADSTTATRSPE